MIEPLAWTEPDRVWTLRELDLFRDLSTAEMEAIAAAAPMRVVGKGQVVLAPGQRREVLVIVKKGRVRLYRVALDGRSLTTGIIRAGEMFGEMAALGQHADDGFAETLEECVLCEMGRRDVQRLLLADPRIAGRIVEQLGTRVAELERRLSDTVLRSVPTRIASALAAMAPEGRGVLRLTHEQLAELVGTTRETTTKVLSDLRDRDLVAMRRGRIFVRDAAGLRRLADLDSAGPALGGTARS